MNLNLIQQPNTFTPAYNNQYFVLSADTAISLVESNFQYIFDLYNALDNSLLGRFKFPLYASTVLGVFDANTIIKDYVSHDLTIEDEGFELNNNSYFSYFVTGGYEFTTGTSTTVQYINQVTSNTITAINEVIKPLDFIDYNFVETNNNKVLTDNPNTTNSIGSNDYYWLSMFSTGNSFYSATITGYNSNNSVVSSDNIINTNTGNTVNLYRLGVGTANLRRFIANGLVDQWSKYIVDLKNVSGNTLYTYTFNVSDCNGKHKDIYRFIWLNNKGGFDSYTFNKKSVKETNIKRTLVGNTISNFNSNNIYGYDYNASETFVSNVNLQDSYTVNTDWISEDTYNFLTSSLVNSPIVYLQQNSKLISVSINNNNTVKKTRLNDGLISLEISFTPNLSYQRQSY